VPVKRDSSGNTGAGADHDDRRIATVIRVKTTRRRTAVGALGACVLLLSATACSSDSDQAAETLPEVAVEDTAGATEAPATQAPSTDPAAGTTSPPDTGGGDATTAEPAPTEPAVVVPEALQFTAPLVGGGTYDGAAAAGKPTVFWFWAPT
jgi:hypothetical protein